MTKEKWILPAVILLLIMLDHHTLNEILRNTDYFQNLHRILRTYILGLTSFVYLIRALSLYKFLSHLLTFHR